MQKCVLKSQSRRCTLFLSFPLYVPTWTDVYRGRRTGGLSHAFGLHPRKPKGTNMHEYMFTMQRKGLKSDLKTSLRSCEAMKLKKRRVATEQKVRRCQLTLKMTRNLNAQWN